MRIFHIATAADWAAAQLSGAYTTSTIGVTLEQEGFLHASRADQWEAVRERYYADVTEPLVLLEIDTDLLDVPWVEELPAPEATETFPHVYGPLAPDAVVAVTPLARRNPRSQALVGAGTEGSRMSRAARVVLALLLSVPLALGLVALGAGPSVAHEERPASFPDGTGQGPEVPRLRQPAVRVVCRPGQREADREAARRQGQAAEPAAAEGVRVPLHPGRDRHVRKRHTSIYVLPGHYQEKPVRRQQAQPLLLAPRHRVQGAAEGLGVHRQHLLTRHRRGPRARTTAGPPRSRGRRTRSPCRTPTSARARTT